MSFNSSLHSIPTVEIKPRETFVIDQQLALKRLRPEAESKSSDEVLRPLCTTAEHSYWIGKLLLMHVAIAC